MLHLISLTALSIGFAFGLSIPFAIVQLVILVLEHYSAQFFGEFSSGTFTSVGERLALSIFKLERS